MIKTLFSILTNYIEVIPGNFGNEDSALFVFKDSIYHIVSFFKFYINDSKNIYQ